MDSSAMVVAESKAMSSTEQETVIAQEGEHVTARTP